jgi:hypothetical protein
MLVVALLVAASVVSAAALAQAPGPDTSPATPDQAELGECSSASDHPEWVFCHDFEPADAGDWATYWNDTYGVPDRVFIVDDNPAGLPGQRAMRLQIVNDTDAPFASGVGTGPKKFLGAVVDWDDLYYRRYIRFNDDFQQGNFMHLGGLGACHPDDYPWRCMGRHDRPNGHDRFSSNLEPWSEYQSLPWPGRWGFYSYYYRMHMDCGHPGPDDCFGDMFAPDEPVLIPRGEWHVIEMMIHPGTPGGADGSQAFWVDGRLAYATDGMAWRTTDELRLNKVGVYLYVHNNPARTTNILDVDNVVISREYIGPAPCEDGAAIGVACACGGRPQAADDSYVHASGYCCSGVWRDTPCSSAAAIHLPYLSRRAPAPLPTSVDTTISQTGNGGQLLFQEDFDDADFASRGWYDNTDLELSATEHITGSTSSAEFHFEQGATTPTSGGAIRRKLLEAENIYVSYHVKYSSNWVGSNRTYHPHEFLILTNLDDDWVGPAYTHMTAYVEQNNGEPLLAIQDAQNIDESNIGVDLTGTTEDRAVAGCNGDSDGYGEGSCYLVGSVHRNGKGWRAGNVYFTDAQGPYYKNDWHFVEAFFEVNSISEGKGIADGVIRYWYDGQLIIDHDDVVLRTAQHPDMAFNQFMIAPWIGDGSPVDQTFWVDDLTVATSRPSTDPSLALSAAAADQSVHLDWIVTGALPVTSTWQIVYDGRAGDQPSTVTGITNPTRAYTLTGLTNHTWYTVTLNAMLPPAIPNSLDSTPFLTNTVQVMPTGLPVCLPFMLRSNDP